MYQVESLRFRSEADELVYIHGKVKRESIFITPLTISGLGFSSAPAVYSRCMHILLTQFDSRLGRIGCYAS